MATILVVDDYPASRQSLVLLLGEAGYHICEAAHGAEALTMVRAEDPDLVITDLLMPTMDGLEFARQLRADPSIAHTPVLVYTGIYLTSEAEVLARACGIAHVLPKPLNRDVVLAAVEGALSRPGPAPVSPPAPSPGAFAREHLQLLTNTLTQKVTDLETINQRLTIALTAQKALADENARLYADGQSCVVALEQEVSSRQRMGEALAAEARFLKAQVDVAHVALSSLQFQVLLPKLLEVIVRAQGYSSGCFWQTVEGGQAAMIVATFGEGTAELCGLRQDVNEPDSFVGQRIRTGQPAFCNRIQETPFSSRPITRTLQQQALLALPLIRRTGEVLGALTFGDAEDPNRFSERDLFQGEVLASQVSQALENCELFSRVQHVEEQYRVVTDSLHDAVYTLDKEGKITFANPALERLTGYLLQELIGHPSRTFYTPEVIPILRERLQQALQGEAVAPHVEAALVRKDGARVPVELSGANLVMNGEIGGRAVVLRDLTERKRAEAEMERQRREGEVLAELVQTINASLELSTVLQRIIEGAQELCGSDLASIALREPGSEAMGIRHQTGNIGHEFSHVRIQLGRGIGGLALATGRPVRTDHYTEDPRISQEYIEVIRAEEIVSAMAVPICTAGQVEGVIYLANRALRPFTDQDEEILQRLADQVAIAIHNARLFAEVSAGRKRLQALSRRLVEVQEAERRAIARELHDEVGQLLTGLNLLLERGMGGDVDAVRPRLGEAQLLVADLLTRVRELSLDLRPAMLDDLGLLHAVLWYVERYSARTQVRVDFKHSGLERRVGTEIETAVYRIVQEALTNVARHAGAQVAVVRVWVDEVEVGVRIEDQGQGFDASEVGAALGSGIVGMEERAVMLGGQLTVESAPGAGTQVTAAIPLSLVLGKRSTEQ